jgi:hypothetical protein
MHEKINVLVSRFQSGHLSRRQMVGELAALFAGTASAGTLRAPQQQTPGPRGKSLLTSEELKPFEEIARRKGVPIHKGTFDTNSKLPSSKIHLDMDMVEESIRSAITQARKTRQTLVQSKLERLLQAGTDAQKVEFVLGSGTYYFPEDIEILAKRSRLAGGKSLEVDCHKVCETIWYYICRCTGSEQQCRTEARELCHIVCD